MPYRDPKDPRKLEKVYEWAAANPEKVREAKKKYAEKNKEACKLRVAQWMEKNKEKMKEARKAWRLNNRHRDIANTRFRQLRKKQRTPKWLTDDDKWLMEQAYDLAVLRTKLFGFQWDVDHIVPLNGKLVSGFHVPWNLQVIPGVHNSSKGNRV